MDLISQNPIESHQISYHLTESHQILPNLTISHRISQNLISHQISTNLIKCTKFQQISPYLTKFYKISSDLTDSFFSCLFITSFILLGGIHLITWLTILPMPNSAWGEKIIIFSFFPPIVKLLWGF